ncbi:hypothetical protein OSJ98_26495, partial [Escherichia coli]|nr:hypothetical protein [Escherichia coli]
GNLQVRLDINRSGGDELDTIADHFNDMCAKLEEYIQKSYTAEIEKKNAQMQALQRQLSLFLFPGSFLNLPQPCLPIPI